MQAVGYVNAGTVEFLLDAEKNFYFLEVNARIQVEHPITEMITGIDLVKQQIRIARGEALPFRQEDLSIRGHALECRIYAEDPANNFLPAIGTLERVQEPSGPDIRCDSGIYEGMEVSLFYDPILAKLIVRDEDRPQALARMQQALSDFVLLGIKSPIPFLKDVLAHPQFLSGDLHTGFLEEHFPDWKASVSGKVLQAGILAAALAKKSKVFSAAGEDSRAPASPWQLLGGWKALEQS
jgi:acetyl/propionyl-CoA carboxylase alpha subunit